MPIRLVGRECAFKGKTLFEIALNLKNFGEGRVVYRQQWTRYPEVSYYKLTKVLPVMGNETRSHGKVWAEKVFRGEQFKEGLIESGNKQDWRLVPRHLEQEFCKLPETKRPVTTFLEPQRKLPPLMELHHRRLLKQKGFDDTKPILMDVVLKPNTRAVLNEEA